MNLFLTQLRAAGRPTLKVRTHFGCELANSFEVCSLLHDKFDIYLQTNGGYSSWLNDKAEWHIHTLQNMKRKALGNSNLSSYRWCFFNTFCC